MTPSLRYGTHAATALAIALACHACASAPVFSPEGTRAEGGVTPPSVQELRNTMYSGLDQLGSVTLTDGRWTGPPVVAGGASTPIVELADGLRIVGDLDGDHVNDAVVVLTYRPGGSAVFSFVAVVSRTGGTLGNVATIALGDRVQIRWIRMEAGVLRASAVRGGVGDAACCPGEVVNWQWRLANRRLNALGAPTTGRLSLDTLGGTVWVLRAWDAAEPAALEPIVSLAYDAGRFAGSSGCNRYSAAVASGVTPGEVKVGVLAGTRMACPDPHSAVEARFLEQLGGAQRVGFVQGRLAITYVTGNGATGVMLFDAGTEGTARAQTTASANLEAMTSPQHRGSDRARAAPNVDGVYQVVVTRFV